MLDRPLQWLFPRLYQVRRQNQIEAAKLAHERREFEAEKDELMNQRVQMIRLGEEAQANLRRAQTLTVKQIEELRQERAEFEKLLSKPRFSDARY
jgi:hypothetical protein